VSTTSGTGPPPEVAPVRPGEALPWDRLTAYLREHIEGLDGDFSVEQFPNGSANLTYRLRFGSQRLVLRRPPFGQVAPRAHDMRREFKVLSQLWRHYPRAPRALHLATDHDIVGSDFIVVEYRPGDVVRGPLPPSMQGLLQVGPRIGAAVVRALADLHRLDPEQCGMSDLGRPEGFVQRQVEGWRARWDALGPVVGSEMLAAVADQLSAEIPEPQRASILHNDFKVDNCQFQHGHPDEVVSVFDWDMATVGDPLVDFGTLLNYWPDPTDTPNDRAVSPDGLDRVGLPPRSIIVQEYATATGLDLRGIRWYEAFASFKTAVVVRQLSARWERGESIDPRMADRARWIAPATHRAARLLGID
jgi:aminoglycoside phosphotransferase (APT) family kinase protein